MRGTRHCKDTRCATGEESADPMLDRTWSNPISNRWYPSHFKSTEDDDRRDPMHPRKQQGGHRMSAQEPNQDQVGVADATIQFCEMAPAPDTKQGHCEFVRENAPILFGERGNSPRGDEQNPRARANGFRSRGLAILISAVQIEPSSFVRGRSTPNAYLHWRYRDGTTGRMAQVLKSPISCVEPEGPKCSAFQRFPNVDPRRPVMQLPLRHRRGSARQARENLFPELD